jgi:hypothetical protein
MKARKHEAHFDAPIFSPDAAVSPGDAGRESLAPAGKESKKPMPILGFLGRSWQETKETEDLNLKTQPTQEAQESYKAKTAVFALGGEVAHA